MSQIDLNFEEINEKFVGLEPGLYDAELSDAEVKRNKAGTGDNLVVEHTVSGDTPQAGRKITNYLSISHPMGQTSIKRLMLSCGIDPGAGGLDTTELIGKVCKIQVISEPYKDPQTGEEKPSSRIKDYVLPV